MVEIKSINDIEITHNPVKQLVTRHYKVSNGQLAEEIIQKFCNSKRSKGYKLRHVYDHENDVLELSDRKSLNVNMAERRLRESGLKVRRVRWTNVFQKKLEDFKWR